MTSDITSRHRSQSRTRFLLAIAAWLAVAVLGIQAGATGSEGEDRPGDASATPVKAYPG
jgi:hypothetical protein